MLEPTNYETDHRVTGSPLLKPVHLYMTLDYITRILKDDD